MNAPNATKPSAVIADDEPLLREHLRHKLRILWPELQIVGEAVNGLEASALIDQHEPTVAFLDIKMPGRTGIEVAQGIDCATRVVFATAFDQFAVAAFENQALDYLLKPIDTARLAQTVQRLKLATQAASPLPDLSALLGLLARAGAPTATAHLAWIRASRGDTVYQIPVDEVRCFQSDDKYTVVHTPDGEHLIRTSLSELIAQLDPLVFWQVHRSWVVNARCVQSARRNAAGAMALQLQGKANGVPVARVYQGLFKQM
jgi:DNA-binding LytR/AlgR family response regulator